MSNPRATIPIQAAGAKVPTFDYFTTKKDELVGWARKFSIDRRAREHLNQGKYQSEKACESR